jgi:hypothetical protein
MPEVALTIMITRTLLALGDLSVNDHVNYYAAPSTPGQVSYQRTAITSPFVDDDITVHRRRGKVTEEMVFEVLDGTTGTAASLEANLSALLNALRQDSFTITSTFNGVAHAWACEAADFQIQWSGPRHVARQFQVTASVPRSPVPLSGSF